MKGLLFLILFQLVLFRRKGCLLKGLFFSFAGGMSALLISGLTLTKGTILFSGTMGLPGVLLLSLLRSMGIMS